MRDSKGSVFVQNLCELIRRRKMKLKAFNMIINLYHMILLQASEECG